MVDPAAGGPLGWVGLVAKANLSQPCDITITEMTTTIRRIGEWLFTLKKRLRECRLSFDSALLEWHGWCSTRCGRLPRPCPASSSGALVHVAMRTDEPSVELKAGDVAPDFSLPGSDGRTYRLRDLAGHIVVVAWFPKAFTGG